MGARSILVAAAAAVCPVIASGQTVPDDLTAIPALATDFQPARTAWGDPDFRGTWPFQPIVEAEVPLERPEEAGNRAWQTDEEFAARIAEAEKSDSGVGFEASLAEHSIGIADWVRTSHDGRRTSLIIEPSNGRLPPLTPAGDALTKAGKTSWKNEPIDWISDLDTFDRCITRGLPGIMLPSMGNNAVRVFQAPGFVVLKLEMIETRIIPLTPEGHRSEEVRSWMGESRGHWEGDTLVIETTHIADGDGTGADPAHLAASPAYEVAPMPVSRMARVTERLRMIGPATMEYRVTYSDPEVFTAPWSAQFEWTRDPSYRQYEYACHEGNVQVRDMINSSRAQRRLDAEAVPSAAP